MRPQDWPALLDGYIDAARVKPFAWGSHDCVSLTCDWLKLMTGRDPYARFRGRYDSEAGGHRLMIEHRVHGMDEAGRFLFGEPRIANTYIQRGDIVLALGALGICVGGQGMFLTEDGMTFFVHAKFELGWSV